jgi:5-methylcytosine-specific restriction endonuclease McrA
MDSNIPTKRCSTCGNEYPATTDYFYARIGRKYDVAGTCKKCHIARVSENSKRPEAQARDKAYQQSPKYKAYRHEYERRPEVRARTKAYGQSPKKKAYNKAYREKRKEQPEQRSKQNEWTIAYHKTPRGKAGQKAAHHNRRLVKQSGSVTANDIELQFKSQNGRCWHCGKKISSDNYHLDHLVPLARGGKHDPRNIVISCPHCNLSKGAKLPQEWNGRLF